MCAGAATAVVVARLRLLDVPLERDEGEYAYGGQLLLRGHPPFHLAYSMKMPGTAAAYAAVMATLGESPAGIRGGLLAFSAASALLLFLLARPLWGRATAAVAAVQFLVLAVLPTVLGQAAHATQFATFFCLAGTLAAARAPSAASAALAGALFGTAFLMKQHALLMAPIGLLLLAGRPLVGPGNLRLAAAFLAGALGPLLVTLALLASGRTLGRWWAWTFVYARDYVRVVRPGQSLAAFVAELRQMAAGAPVPLLLAAVGLARSLRGGQRGRERILLFGLTAFGLACAWPGLYARPHYFVPILPGLALAAAVGVTALSPPRPGAGGGWREAATLALVAASLGQPLWRYRDLLFRSTPEAVNRVLYGTNPFAEAAVIGRFLRHTMSSEGRLAVLGSEPEIYFYAQRLSATGYLYTYPLVDAHRNARRMQREMADEIGASRPEYVVFVNSSRSWHRGSLEGEPIYEWFVRYRARELERVGIVEMAAGVPSAYRWGAAARGQPAGGHWIEVLRRRR